MIICNGSLTTIRMMKCNSLGILEASLSASNDIELVIRQFQGSVDSDCQGYRSFFSFLKIIFSAKFFYYDSSIFIFFLFFFCLTED